MKMQATCAVAALAALTLARGTAEGGSLAPPDRGAIRVAFVMTSGATMIDFAGPWEVFQDVTIPDRDPVSPFELYTVGASREPIRTSGGMRVTPDFTFEDAPQPHVVVIGAQRGAPGLTDWLQRVSPGAQVVMSVCTGAFKLADAGLLDGRRATTHHDFYDRFASRFPKVTLVRDKRFVASGDRFWTAGGLTSGIDLALHVVALYFGEPTARQTAEYMEYEGEGWRSAPLATHD